MIHVVCTLKSLTAVPYFIHSATPIDLNVITGEIKFFSPTYADSSGAVRGRSRNSSHPSCRYKLIATRLAVTSRRRRPTIRSSSARSRSHKSGHGPRACNTDGYISLRGSELQCKGTCKVAQNGFGTSGSQFGAFRSTIYRKLCIAMQFVKQWAPGSENGSVVKWMDAFVTYGKV